MKKAVAMLVICICFLFPFAVRADAAAPAASDAVLRAELRLSELGYYFGSIDGVENDAYFTALSAFYAAYGAVYTGEIPRLLFAENAKPAPFSSHASTFVRTSGTPLLTGDPIPWDEARTLLVSADTCTVTACYSGITFVMRCTDADGCANLQPALDWDASCAASLFGDRYGFEKQPVVVTVGSARIAGSLQACLPAGGETEIPTDYTLYCTASRSDFHGLTDVDHALMVEIASGMA